MYLVLLVFTASTLDQAREFRTQEELDHQMLLDVATFADRAEL